MSKHHPEKSDLVYILKDNETSYRACLQETSSKNKRKQLPVSLNILSMGVLFVPSFVVQAETERHTEGAQLSSSKQQPSPLLTACTILPAENQTPSPIHQSQNSIRSMQTLKCEALLTQQMIYHIVHGHTTEVTREI